MNDSDTLHEACASTAQSLARKANAKIRVLLAEDDYMVATVVRLMLENQGYEVVATVKDGQAAVASVSELRPDVVVMDLKMPVMNGLEATRHILEAHPTPVIILSAYDIPEQKARAFEAGAVEYLVKPATEHDFATAIRHALSQLLLT